MFLFGKIRMLWAWDCQDTFEIYDKKKIRQNWNAPGVGVVKLI